jgi:disease resistance protein RPS2
VSLSINSIANLLCQNRLLGFIADSFFKQLHGLKVLDLSWTDIEKLPDSVSDLVSLTALLLNDCESLRHVSSLKKLRALKRLDLSRTGALENIVGLLPLHVQQMVGTNH